MTRLLSITKKVLHNTKRLFIIITVLAIVFTLFSILGGNPLKGLSKESASEINRKEIYKVLRDPHLNSTKEGRAGLLIYKQTLCGLIGEACTNNPADADKNFHGSAFGFVSDLITFPITNPPASGLYWAYSGLQSSGFVPKSYASEGIGFAAIKGYLKLWTVFRNISFMLIVLVLVFIGFMIMFKIKVNPQTIITLENSLPRIFIYLILITFSFAIAGFMIDLMYLIITLFVSQITTINIPDFQAKDTIMYINKYTGASFADIMPGVGSEFFDVGKSFLNILPGIVQDFLRLAVSGIATFLLQKWSLPAEMLQKAIDATTGIGGSAGGGVTIGPLGGGSVEAGINVGNLAKWIGLLGEFFIFILIFPIMAPLIVAFIIFLTLFGLLFRVFFLLLKTYIKILLYIIFAPLYLLTGMFPGQNAFWKWFKNLGVNLLTFPVIVVLIMIGEVIMKINIQQNQFWAPPFLYGIDAKAFSVILGIGIILLIPDLIKAMRQTLGIKDSPVQFGMSTLFGAAGMAAAGGSGLWSKYLDYRYKFGTLPQKTQRFLQKIPGFKDETPGGHARPVSPWTGRKLPPVPKAAPDLWEDGDGT